MFSFSRKWHIQNVWIQFCALVVKFLMVIILTAVRSASNACLKTAQGILSSPLLLHALNAQESTKARIKRFPYSGMLFLKKGLHSDLVNTHPAVYHCRCFLGSSPRTRLQKWIRTLRPIKSMIEVVSTSVIISKLILQVVDMVHISWFNQCLMFLNTIVLRFEEFRGAVGCQCRTMSFTHVNNDVIKRLLR